MQNKRNQEAGKSSPKVIDLSMLWAAKHEKTGLTAEYASYVPRKKFTTNEQEQIEDIRSMRARHLSLRLEVIRELAGAIELPESVKDEYSQLSLALSTVRSKSPALYEASM